MGQDLGDDAVEMVFFLDQVLFSQFQKCKRVGNVDIRTTPNKCLTKISKNIKHNDPSEDKPGPKKAKYKHLCNHWTILGSDHGSVHGIPGYPPP